MYGNVCKILLSVFAGALAVQACSMKWLHGGPADNKKAKSVVFGVSFIRQVNTAISNYKNCYPANTIIYR